MVWRPPNPDRSVLRALALIALAAAPPAAAQSPIPAAAPASHGRTQWRVDVTHSELMFRIRHLVSRVPGTFLDWSGVLAVNPDDLAGGSVEVTIQAASISTRNDRRDSDLRSANFFEVETYPTMTFVSRTVTVSGERMTVEGDLTIRGSTRPVVLEGSYEGVVGEPGRRRIGFSAATTINRLDYGLTWNRLVEGGGVVLGDEVAIAITIAAVETAPAG